MPVQGRKIGNFGNMFEIGAENMMLSIYKKDRTLYMIARIHKEKGKVKDHYRIVSFMPNGRIGVDISRTTKLKNLQEMQYRLDDMADENGWKWHGKIKTPYEIEELYGNVLEDYFTMKLK